MEYAWAGHLCLTLNGVSVMRKLDDGLYSGCVQNGLGTARGTLTGIGAAELACGATSDITAHFTAEDRPKRLPPRPLSDIGANAVTLRWKEWRARARVRGDGPQNSWFSASIAGISRSRRAM
jgi:hypothetical protein